MKTKYFLGAAGAALVLGGISLTTNYVDADKGVAFANPVAIARAMCGNGDVLAKRREFFISAAKAYAQAAEDTDPSGPKLTPDLGAIHYAVTSSKPETQGWFDQGVAYVYNFNHAEGVKAFKQAQKIDPDCAMCYWGEAFAYGPNINAPMSDDDVPAAWAAVQKAVSLKAKASAKEGALIDALAKRYAKAPLADRSALDAAFADAMDQVATQYPDDDFIAALAVEANMDTQPWDYWADGGRTPKGRTARSISLLEGVLARNPDYTAAIHLYIHMTEASNDPYRAANFADRLAKLTPGLGHLIHMPSHTYYRIGRFKQSLANNIEAVKIDQAYVDANDASILYEYGYFVHNVHFALTSAQMAGDGATALAMAKKLDEKLPADMAAVAPWVQPIKAAPYYALVQFGAPEDILSLDDPGAEMPFLQGAWRYARGEALARAGNPGAAMKEAEALSKLIAEADFSPLTGGGVPALDILNIARLTVIARASAAEGDFATAVEAMEEAVALQDALAYMEPPFWYYPAKQTLAAMVLQAGDGERAEQLFLESLAESPNNSWVLYGLAESYKVQGQKSAAKYADALFKDSWLGDKAHKLAVARL
ncbi:MAG: hypothetical protein R3C58_15520 [Parvularculaceae bacterium]